MKRKNILYLVLLMVNTTIAQAQETQKTSFSLTESVEYSKTHNRNIQNADLGIQAAEEQRWETIATGLPQINGQLDYTNNIKNPIEGDPNNPADPINFFFPNNKLAPSVTLSQLIFDGSYIVGLQASKVFLDISQNYKEKTDNQIEEAVVNAYMTSLLTDESILILEKNIENIEENLTEAQAVVANGLAEEESIEQLQLTLASLQNSMRNFEVLSEVSEGYVKLLLGIDSEISIVLSDDLDVLIGEYTTLEPVYAENSIFNNIDYKIAVNETESKELLYKLEKAKYIPTIAAYLNTNYQAFNNDFVDLFSSEQPWLNSTSVGVSLSIPIFSSFKTRAQKRRAKVNWTISENQLKDTEQELKLDLKKAKSEYILATETYENKKRNLALAEKIERKNSIKFKEGMTSSIDLRSVQVQLYSSQQDYIESIINVINRKVALKNLLNLK